MKKHQWILIGVTAMFVCVLVGVFIGRNLSGNYVPLNNADVADTQTTVAGNQEKDGRIDLNSATFQQLTLLPGIGDTIAQHILDYRTENGDFKAVEELLNVNGIGEKKLEQIRPYVKVQGE